MRVVGALLVGCGVGAIGVGKMLRLQGRVKDLGELILGLETVKRELNMSRDRLEQILGTAADSTGGRGRAFFLFCRDGLRQEEFRGLARVWADGLRACPLRLQPCDLSAIQALGTVLGRYDAPEQIAALERTIGKLDVQLTEAKAQRETMGKVYGTLGVSVGAALVILLI